MHRARRKAPIRRPRAKPLNVQIVDPNVMTLHQVADFIGKTTGVKPHCNTVQRWVLVGVRGHQLRATRVGHLYVCHRDDVLKFLTDTNSAAAGKAVDSEAIRKARAEESKRRHRILASELGLDN